MNEERIYFKKNEFFKEIFVKFPENVKDILASKTEREQQLAILGYADIGFVTIIESFCSENMRKLTSLDVSLWDKSWIIYRQNIYLKELGINTLDDRILKCETEEDVIKYLDFLKQDYVSNFIPSEELANYIRNNREVKYKEALKDYYTSRSDFKTIMRIFDNAPKAIDIIYEQIKNRRVCVWGVVEGVVIMNLYQ